MKNLFLICFGLCIYSLSMAQFAIQINPDGTHTVLHQVGHMFVGTNSDGTHSVGTLTGNVLTTVNSNGTHSTAIVHGNTIVSVDSEGQHRVTFLQGNLFDPFGLLQNQLEINDPIPSESPTEEDEMSMKSALSGLLFVPLAIIILIFLGA